MGANQRVSPRPSGGGEPRLPNTGAPGLREVRGARAVWEHQGRAGPDLGRGGGLKQPHPSGSQDTFKRMLRVRGSLKPSGADV